MNKFSVFVFKCIRKAFEIFFGFKKSGTRECIQDPDEVYHLISKAINSKVPCMIARFGSTELACLVNYIGISKGENKLCSYLTGKASPWWWEPKIIDQLHVWSGFFPPTYEKVKFFCELMIKDISDVDILASWLDEELIFENELKNSVKIHFELLNPYFSKIPWTTVLKNKKVLVVHPFNKSIEKQYAKRELLFDKEILPEFELQTIQAVQSIAKNRTNFTDWFEALNHMKLEIENRDFDICLIGCGAYGFPLAAHVKRLGKKGIHMGGNLQLLFGIKGKRWESSNYSSEFNFNKLFNEHWVYPEDIERPENFNLVEEGTYW